MYDLLKPLSRLIFNDAWFIAAPRIILFLVWGTFTLLKPAAGLRIGAWALIPAGCAALLPLVEATTAKYRWFFLAAPLLLYPAVVLPPRYDMAGFWCMAALSFIAARRSWSGKTLLFRLTACCAAAAGLIFIVKSFTGDWFDLYPAAALVLFGTAGLEAGFLKTSK